MKIRMICGLCLLLVSLLVVFPPAAVLAQDETPPPEKIELTTSYTKLEGTAGASFEFEITLNYQGTEARLFNLSAIGPKDWTTYITPSYPKDKMILDIRLEAGATYDNKINVHTAPSFWLVPEPGEYQITVEASSGEVKGTIDLTAVVTASYQMSLTTADERLNTTATAGKDNFFSVVVTNTGSAAIDNITFSSSKPSGWTIDFNPTKIDSLNADGSQTIEVNIKPPSKTIAGDYQITLTASGKQISDDIDIRVTVETPTVWGWVGVGIIVLVVAGLAFVFMRFSRR
jgi:uncharacterized membrane protein